MESKRVMCQHCEGWFFPEEGVPLDDCPKCGRTVEVKPAPAPLPGFASFVTLAAKAVDNAFEVIAQLRAHITDLTRRLAEAEHFASYAVQAVIDFAHLEREDYPDGMTLEQMREAMQTHLDEVVAQVERRLETAEARARELEAFKARAMEWARGRCGACGHEGSEGDTCYDCNSDDERSNWTPPKAWEVGE